MGDPSLARFKKAISDSSSKGRQAAQEFLKSQKDRSDDEIHREEAAVFVAALSRAFPSADPSLETISDADLFELVDVCEGIRKVACTDEFDDSNTKHIKAARAAVHGTIPAMQSVASAAMQRRAFSSAESSLSSLLDTVQYLPSALDKKAEFLQFQRRMLTLAGQGCDVATMGHTERVARKVAFDVFFEQLRWDRQARQKELAVPAFNLIRCYLEAESPSHHGSDGSDDDETAHAIGLAQMTKLSRFDSTIEPLVKAAVDQAAVWCPNSSATWKEKRSAVDLAAALFGTCPALHHLFMRTFVAGVAETQPLAVRIEAAAGLRASVSACEMSEEDDFASTVAGPVLDIADTVISKMASTDAGIVTSMLSCCLCPSLRADFGASHSGNLNSIGKWLVSIFERCAAAVRSNIRDEHSEGCWDILAAFADELADGFSAFDSPIRSSVQRATVLLNEYLNREDALQLPAPLKSAVQFVIVSGVEGEVAQEVSNALQWVLLRGLRDSWRFIQNAAAEVVRGRTDDTTDTELAEQLEHRSDVFPIRLDVLWMERMWFSAHPGESRSDFSATPWSVRPQTLEYFDLLLENLDAFCSAGVFPEFVGDIIGKLETMSCKVPHSAVGVARSRRCFETVLGLMPREEFQDPISEYVKSVIRHSGGLPVGVAVIDSIARLCVDHPLTSEGLECDIANRIAAVAAPRSIDNDSVVGLWQKLRPVLCEQCKTYDSEEENDRYDFFKVSAGFSAAGRLIAAACDVSLATQDFVRLFFDVSVGLVGRCRRNKVCGLTILDRLCTFGSAAAIQPLASAVTQVFTQFLRKGRGDVLRDGLRLASVMVSLAAHGGIALPRETVCHVLHVSQSLLQKRAQADADHAVVSDGDEDASVNSDSNQSSDGADVQSGDGNSDYNSDGDADEDADDTSNGGSGSGNSYQNDNASENEDDDDGENGSNEDDDDDEEEDSNDDGTIMSAVAAAVACAEWLHANAADDSVASAIVPVVPHLNFTVCDSEPDEQALVDRIAGTIAIWAADPELSSVFLGFPVCRDAVLEALGTIEDLSLATTAALEEAATVQPCEPSTASSRKRDRS